MPSLVNRGRGRRTINEINMVPFIDVMLVLLIIFMVTAPLITPSQIDLPTVGKASRAPDQIIQIIITRKEAIELKLKDKTTSIGLKDLPDAVRRAQTSDKSAVVIGADKSVRYETVVKVMDTLQRAGIQRIGLSVQMVN
ncbi:MAG: biopolymer transporter ExbD [Hylemonella sp.]|nr:biopolymer transporter ExbD [Hylemonella sp.]MDH5709824.1 biopolymer transporter ExbD [Hylemonella sp.]